LDCVSAFSARMKTSIIGTEFIDDMMLLTGPRGKAAIYARTADFSRNLRGHKRPLKLAAGIHQNHQQASGVRFRVTPSGTKQGILIVTVGESIRAVEFIRFGQHSRSPAGNFSHRSVARIPTLAGCGVCMLDVRHGLDYVAEKRRGNVFCFRSRRNDLFSATS
jgi:hypothetical protein